MSGQSVTEHVLGLVTWPVAVAHERVASSMTAPETQIALAVFGICSIVVCVLVVVLYAAAGLLEWASARSLSMLARNDLQLERYAAVHVRVELLVSLLRPWAGLGGGPAAPQAVALPGIAAVSPARRLVAWVGRRITGVLLLVVDVARVLWWWVRHPVGIYLAAATWWVVLVKDVDVIEDWLTTLWRAGTSATGIAGVAAAATVLTVMLAHGPGTRLRGRNAYARDVAARGEAVLEAMGVAAADVLQALDRSLDEVPPTRRVVVRKVLDEVTQGALLLDGDVVRASRESVRARRRRTTALALIGGPHRAPAVDDDLQNALERLAATAAADDVAGRAAVRQARRSLRSHVTDVRLGCLEGRRVGREISTSRVEGTYRSGLAPGWHDGNMPSAEEMSGRLARIDAELRSSLWDAYLYRARVARLTSLTQGAHRPRGIVMRLLSRLS